MGPAPQLVKDALRNHEIVNKGMEEEMEKIEEAADKLKAEENTNNDERR